MTSPLTEDMAVSLRKLLDDPNTPEMQKNEFRRLLSRYDSGEDDDFVESCCA